MLDPIRLFYSLHSLDVMKSGPVTGMKWGVCIHIDSNHLHSTAFWYVVERSYWMVLSNIVPVTWPLCVCPLSLTSILL